jgi:nucleotidyltransferase substrate binding protein (TIGR01987 family)
MSDREIKIESFKTQLIKASSKFKEFKNAPVSEMSKAASIQAFEYTFELSWKYIREALKNTAQDYFDSPKGVIKLAGKMNILTISQVEKWILYANNRNLTVHIYREDIADSIFNSLISFGQDVDDLIEVIDRYFLVNA